MPEIYANPAKYWGWRRRIPRNRKQRWEKEGMSGSVGQTLQDRRIAENVPIQQERQ
jgi:hypothetical protein